MVFSKSKHNKKASSLVQFCNSLAVSSFESFSDKFPILKDILPNGELRYWDFYFSVAAVGAAISMIDETVSERNFKSFTYSLKEKLNEWHPKSYEAFSDLSSYVQNRRAKNIEQEISLGMWIILNFQKDKLGQNDVQLAQSIGKYLLITFANYNWWKDL